MYVGKDISFAKLVSGDDTNW
jgi:hypothetical protein